MKQHNNEGRLHCVLDMDETTLHILQHAIEECHHKNEYERVLYSHIWSGYGFNTMI